MDRKKLVDAVRAADAAYYSGAEPTMSDAEYDALKRELAGLAAEGDPEAVALAKAVGAPVSGPGRVRHAKKMLSLANCFDRDEFSKFFSALESARASAVRDGAVGQTGPAAVAEPKLDGISFELVYDGPTASLVSASTRGDGEWGEDATEKALRVQGVLASLGDGAADAGPVTVRGEVVFKKSDFEQMNETRKLTGLPPFANPRNAVAGTMALDDLDEIALRRPSFVAYDFRQDFPQGRTGYFTVPYDRAQAMELLRSFGFETVRQARCWSLTDCFMAFSAAEEQRDSWPFEADGVVFKAADFAVSDSMGDDGRDPAWAVAWKFSARKAVTKLLSVTAQVGGTGRVTPVAELEPVSLAGVVVRRATLHNYDFLERMDVRPGDSVVVSRAGDVIPQVDGLAPIQVQDSRSGEWADRPRVAVPSRCPLCGTVLEKVGAYLECPSPDCGRRLQATLCLWVSRGMLDIDGLGGTTVSRLVSAGLVKSVPDLFRLDADAFASVDGVGRRSAEKWVAALDRSKKSVPLAKFLVALRLPGVGWTHASAVAKKFGTLASVRSASAEDFASVDGIGFGTAEQVAAAVARLEADSVFSDYEEAGVVVEPENEGDRGSSGPLAGQVVVFTGTLTVPRSAAQAAAAEAGATVAGGVTSKTTLLVAGENCGSKLDLAKKLGVRVVTQAQFEEELGSKL